MTGLTILLFCLAGLLMAAAVGAIYAREQRGWSVSWGAGEREGVLDAREKRDQASAPTGALDPMPTESAEVDVLAGEVAERTRRRMYPNDVFRYTIRRPSTAVRRTTPNLGGFSEVPLRLYDQLGNRFTVHQKVRLN